MLKSERIILRPINAEDAPVIYSWGKDPLYHETAGFEHFEDFSQAQEAAKRYSQRKYSYAVVLRNTQQMIGLAELYERGLDQTSGLLKTKDLGFMLDQKYWGQGLMTEALTLLLNYAFNELEQNQVWAGTFATNDRSQRLLNHLGFRYVYTVDYDQVSAIFNYQEKYFLLTPTDWYDTMHVNTKS